MKYIFENKGKWPQQINEKRLLKKGDRVRVHGQTGTIQQVDWVDPAMTRKIFKVLLDDTKKIEVFKDHEVKAESLYVDHPDDTSDLIDVIDDKGNMQWVTQQTYDRHRAFFQANLAKYQKNKATAQNKRKALDELKALHDKRKKLSNLLKTAHGTNADRYDKELIELDKKIADKEIALYGKKVSRR